MGYHQRRNFLGIPCRIHYVLAHSRSFSQEWQHSAEEVEHKVIATQQKTMSYYNKAAHPLSDIMQGSQVVLQNPKTKLWDTYGVVISVDQHRKYHIKIKSGKVLMKNRRLLCRRVPTLNPEAIKPLGLVITPAAQESLPPTPPSRPRRSSRESKRPQRLVEDPLWN